MEMKKESRHALLQHELTTELKSLRASVRETAEGFILCKEGEIETLLDYLLKMPPGRLKDIARPWLRETRNLKLKPDKGRIKDLKKSTTCSMTCSTVLSNPMIATKNRSLPGKKPGAALTVKTR